jgi:hypothetical protein
LHQGYIFEARIVSLDWKIALTLAEFGPPEASSGFYVQVKPFGLKVTGGKAIF